MGRRVHRSGPDLCRRGWDAAVRGRGGLAFERAIRHAGVPRIRFHDLRHTAATLRLAAGTHPKVVQEMLGHANISITLDIYSHAVPGMQAESAEKVAALIEAAG